MVPVTQRDGLRTSGSGGDSTYGAPVVDRTADQFVQSFRAAADWLHKGCRRTTGGDGKGGSSVMVNLQDTGSCRTTVETEVAACPMLRGCRQV